MKPILLGLTGLLLLSLIRNRISEPEQPEIKVPLPEILAFETDTQFIVNNLRNPLVIRRPFNQTR